MTTVDSTASDRASAGLPVRDRLCEVAIEHFGRFGFDQSMLEMSIAADVDVETLTELFGSIDGLPRGM
jgi:TetR/AcrR family transcriptional regulator, regulator of cefoperazone and chloramphenicol sensitivity